MVHEDSLLRASPRRNAFAMVGRPRSFSFVVAACLASCCEGEEPNAAAAAPSLVVEGSASPQVMKRVGDVLAARFKQIRAFWPERIASERPIRVEVWGTLDEYRAATARRGAPIDNPACYFVGEGVIVLGYDGGRFDESIKRTRDRAEALRRDLEKAGRALAEQLKLDEQRFTLNGTSREERKRLEGERRRAFLIQSAKMKADIEKAERQNRDALDEATARLSTAAAHELFHAYVDGFVYPPEKGGLPAWLNEGLAQIVERTTPTATLGRQTKPDAERARRRDEEQADGDAIGVEALLSADAAKFLIHDANPSGAAGKYYLAAWAVTQALLNDGKLAPGADLDRFVAERGDARSAFQRWTGRSIAEWERLHAK